MPHYYDHHLQGGISRHPDFTKKITALRELFEECNILIAADGSNLQFNSNNLIKNSDGTKLRDVYLHDFDSNFIKFCKKTQIYP